MLFNTIEFAIFLPVVFILYWFVTKKSLKIQNLLLVAASYFFYGWWDWRFLFLIVFSSIVDFLVGRGFAKTNDQKKRKLLLLTSILVNLGFLGFFKYFNFFAENFVQAFSLLGQEFEVSRLNVILPVGISFYTFQTLSYSIDVYKRKLEPTKDFVAFFAFVSFFPQLVAGPIERASNLLPQFYFKRVFNHHRAVDGLRQILWGLFKKMVIADNCAKYVNDIFQNYPDYSGSTLVLGGVFFAFQIYGDFSGYSDIAIGSARLFGFDLKKNFAFPYFSRDIAEFWRRWHISLSTWFRDYLYIPLGGSRGSTLNKIRNIFIIFIVSGFWHGANWTFIIWGALNALYFLPIMLLKRNRINTDQIAYGRWLPSLRDFVQITITFGITIIAWVFFRSPNVSEAFLYLDQMFSRSLFSSFDVLPRKYLIILFLFILFEWINRNREHAMNWEGLRIPVVVRYLFYYLIVFMIFWKSGNHQDFIYFQF